MASPYRTGGAYYGNYVNYGNQQQSTTGGYYPTNQGQTSIDGYQNNMLQQNPNPGNAFGISTQTQPQQQYSYIPGRMVRDEQDIIAKEVPMDGSYGVFVQQDMQTIYAKTWGNDGYIHTNVYRLVNGQQEPQNDPIAEILNRLQRIEERLGETKPQGSNDRPKNNYRKNNYRKNNYQNKNQEEVKND